ncbi:nucleotidyltransferase domain-containing protein [Funiculus sociatus GB2-A5]|uniref:Nucleotidyltransferase domain-containing protein n=1 Tax=Funiculus sociatus GB2-A5 TaxID=2933946 RepID=A0ABV0JSE5_9CYAN|nr:MULTISPECIES: nucleotidyltransferase domain-containing protein [unclassified Trichocoleus]MBD1907465.1 nucleotidyltransferase domain-containing protein [Trichocoleus sp. FACHB-832]MBD2061096.1 nucleotidyltransferase domain-containing protein [Trichocoleus sp. FACHB-6]
MNPNLILPVGTQVVTRVDIQDEAVHTRGSVGVIIKSPQDNSHAYRVEFPDGSVASLRRSELTIRKESQKEGLQPAAYLSDFDLYDYVIYRCIVGSKAYGLDDANSDIDRRGIYLPPADMHWSLYGLPEQLDNKDTEECYWELQKFLTLALKANPNVLECLYTPLVEKAMPLVEELLAIRSIFLSQLVYQTYNGYVMSQFKKLEQDIRTKGDIKWKHAMHLIRVLLSGIEVLNEGFVPVRVEEHRQQLMSIRYGEVSWEEVNAWRLSLHKQFDDAFAVTSLPERPDYEKANAFLIKARRSMV